MTLPAPAQQEPDPPAAVVLGTATPGGGFPVYGQALAETVREVDPALAVELRNTRGSTENIPLLRAGALDVALVQGEPAYEALAAQDGGAAAVPLKVLFAMYATPGMFVVRADSPARSVEDLRGRPVALGAAGSGLTILGRLVLSGTGLDPDRDVRPIYLDRAGDGPAMVADGRAAALWGGGIGWPGFAAVAAAPGGARFLAPSAETIDRLLARHPTLRRLSVPAGTYPGQDAAVETVGSWSLVLARPGLDEAVAYRLARALDRGRAAIARRLPQAAETTAANTVAAVPPGWLHPGAARYLAETGLLRR